MSTGFQELQDRQLTDALAIALVPKLIGILQSREPGHCMRLADLDLALMQQLSNDLLAELNRLNSKAQVYILGDRDRCYERPDLFISSTKLVELRNPLPDGSLRSPLLIFLPNDLQTNAEDSFNVASFEDISVANVYQDLTQILLQELPVTFRGYIKESLVKIHQAGWTWANPIAQVRYLLTAKINGIDGDTLGAALYELGLVPDFHLFDEPSIVQSRLLKNLEAVKLLSEDNNSTLRGRVLSLRLLDDIVRDNLVRLLLCSEIEDPSSWTRQIIIDRQNWELEFSKWIRHETVESGKIQIELTSIDLPIVDESTTEEKLLNLVGSQYLVANNLKKIGGTVVITPSLLQVAGLSYFTIQIISRISGSIGSVKKIKAKRTFKSFTLDKLDKVSFDEGWHCIRVLAWTEDGTQIPIEQNSGNRSSDLARNESDDFYVLTDVELEEDTIPIKATDVISFSHLQLQLQLKAISDSLPIDNISIGKPLWIDNHPLNGKVSQANIEIRCGKNSKFCIPVSSYLKQLECEILKNPRKSGYWQRSASTPNLSFSLQEWTISNHSQVFNDFLDARERYFAEFTSGEFLHISQSIDWSKLEDMCLEYATTYQVWLNEIRQDLEHNPVKHSALQDLRQALAIDSLHLTLKDFRGNRQEVILAGPTHPLRALWFSTWAKIGQHWVNQSLNRDRDFLPSTDDSIQSVSPINIPAFQSLDDGRIFITVDNLTFFWAIYAAPTTVDLQGLISEVCHTLELPQFLRSGASNITCNLLATKVERYLAQHLHIKTLTINTFNLGDIKLLANILSSIQKGELGTILRFDIRLFVPDPDSLIIEESLQTLADLTTSGGSYSNIKGQVINSPLFPKLNLAVYSVSDFEDTPEQYSAHLSFLFDVFPVAAVEVIPAFRNADNVTFYGLAQDFIVKFRQDDAGTQWYRQPRCGQSSSISEVDRLIQCFNDLRTTSLGAIATVSTGLSSFDKRPTITIALEPKDLKFIHQIHSMSDWVFTIDRNLGIEFFDQAASKDSLAYLVDYVPDKNSGCGHQLLVTSRSLTELESILSRLLASKGLLAEKHQCTIVLNQLRALSGRLALKLISSSSHQLEVLGLALARLFLASQGALKNQAIVPIDNHIDLFKKAQKKASHLGESLQIQRTDLALFHLNLPAKTIQCNLVEVKCRSKAGNMSEYQKLKDSIVEQLNSTEQVLRGHYEYRSQPDRLWRASELSNLLTFYVNRADRYRLMSDGVVEESQILLSILEQGYELKFSRIALVFDFSQTEPHFIEQDSGVEFHRIGRELIEKLVKDIDYSQEDATNSSVSIDNNLVSSIAAAFLVPDRNYSITWDTLSQEMGMKTSRSPRSLMEPDLDITKLIPLSSEFPDPIQEISNPEPNIDLQSDAKLMTPCKFDVMLGVQSASSQFGILGEMGGRKVAMDLSEPQTISLFGVQGAGKSYTLGTIIEMACTPIPGINNLPSPLATVVFHYSPTEDYKPEFTSMVFPNSDLNQLEVLRERYGAAPTSLEDVLILTSIAKVEERKAEYPSIQVLPITFASSELKTPHWKFLMGAVGSQSMYLRQINQIMKKLRNEMTLEGLRQGVENSTLADNLKELARARLGFAAEYINDERSLSDVVKPGRLIIVDLRDEFIDKDEALGLFMVMLQLFSDTSSETKSFNKLIVFDEAHKYMQSPDLVAGLVEVVREMRHKGTSILIASQDPASIPISLIELSSQIILHRFNSPAWLKHVQKAVTVLGSLTPDKMSHLDSGEAYIWSGKATDNGFSQNAIKIRCRPRVTLHGGSTKKAH